MDVRVYLMLEEGDYSLHTECISKLDISMYKFVLPVRRDLVTFTQLRASCLWVVWALSLLSIHSQAKRLVFNLAQAARIAPLPRIA